MTREQRELVLRMYANDEKMAVIQTIVGKNRVSIQRFLAKAGVRRRKPGYNRNKNG